MRPLIPFPFSYQSFTGLVILITSAD